MVDKTLKQVLIDHGWKMTDTDMPWSSRILRQRLLRVDALEASKTLIEFGFDVVIKQDRNGSKLVTVEATKPAEQTIIAVENDLLDYVKAKMQDY